MPIIALQHDDGSEQDPEIWLNHIVTGAKRAIEESGVDASKIVGIGMSYQMYGLVIVDVSGYLLRKAIVWCDSRIISIDEKAFRDLGELQCTISD